MNEQIYWTTVRPGKTVECADCKAVQADGATVLKGLKNGSRRFLCVGCAAKKGVTPQGAAGLKGDKGKAQADKAEQIAKNPTILMGGRQYDPSLQMFVEAPKDVDFGLLATYRDKFWAEDVALVTK